LHPEIYGHLTKRLSLSRLELTCSSYLRQWATFLDQTPLTAFCQIPDIEAEREKEPPVEFTRNVTKHLWEPPPKYLRDVDELRKEFASRCSLQSCAVTVGSIRKGCVVITMVVPKLVELSVATDQEFIRVFHITKMVFNDVTVYSQDQSEVGSSVDTVRRVQLSRASVAMKYVYKALFDRPARRMMKRWKTPLTVAAEHGTLQEVRELIASGEDANPYTVATPLKEACSREDLEIARALLEAGADPNMVTDNWTPLMEASRVGNREMIQLLVEFGADLNKTNSDKWTALMAASNNGCTEAVEELLQSRADPNKQDHVGWSALLASVFKCHTARVDARAHYALLYEEISLRLTDAGANPHLQNLEYRSALRLAIEFEQDGVIDAFLERHPDVKAGLRGDPQLNSTDKYRETDLLFACKKKNHRVVKLLLCKGADPDCANIFGEYPLLRAVKDGNIEMVEELLRVGANPNMTTDEGTPLAVATKCGEIEIVKLLLKEKADPNKADFIDQLPLYHARRLQNEKLIELLEDKTNPALEHELPGRVAHYYSRLTKRTTSFFKTLGLSSEPSK
jgi:ankyrin repeat protein